MLVSSEEKKLKHREASRRYRIKNKEKLNFEHRKYYRENTEKVKTGMKKFYSNNKDIMKHRVRMYHLKYRFGLTPEKYLDMIKEQNGKCAICGEMFVDSKNTHVDHCHETGRVRKLLCRKCNAGIGLFMEDVYILQRAIYYIREHGDQK